MHMEEIEPDRLSSDLLNQAVAQIYEYPERIQQLNEKQLELIAFLFQHLLQPEPTIFDSKKTIVTGKQIKNLIQSLTETKDQVSTTNQLGSSILPNLGKLLSDEGPIKNKIDSQLLQKRISSFLDEQEVEQCCLQAEQLTKEGLHSHEMIQVHQLLDRAAYLLFKHGRESEAFAIRAKMAKLIAFDPEHPLYELSYAVGHQIEYQADRFFGAHFNSLNTNVLKGGNLVIYDRNVEGQQKYIVNFKVSHLAREGLGNTLSAIQKNPNIFLENIPSEFSQGIKIREVDYTFRGKDAKGVFSDERGLQITSAKAIEIDFVGVGKLIVGKEAPWTFYNMISIEISAEQKDLLPTMQKMLTMLGLGPIFALQRAEDGLRIKMMHLFRAYYPRATLRMERKEGFLELPPQEMQKKIENRVPQMKAIFRKYLTESPEFLQMEEIYPGQITWAVTDLSTQMKAQGAWGLMAGIMAKDIEQAGETICMILENGALSSQDRFQMGLFHLGASSARDLSYGGGDHVFTRLIGKSHQELNIKKQFLMSGKVQVLYDLDLVNRGGYGYSSDHYGSKEVDTMESVYDTRLNLIELTQEIIEQGAQGTGNEILIKNRIDPQYIRGFVVATQEDKKKLMELFQKKNLVREGKLWGFEKTVDEIIHVSDSFNENMWNQ